ncbi:hypothetical protein ACHAXA_004674 [Cyclostephanos tholiformis]|uniref:Uncharacterized protein n=1 Tax=Cyclostephanos tholiformis TaxID=382380 RepID=A0ABD3R4G0_9STRA
MTETDKTNPSMPDDDRVPSRPLRVCCYGSSSSRTPSRYTDAAYRLGRALALRGHTCVNGAGSFGCMDAMNVGANDAGGRIVGIIHEKFVQEGGDWFEGTSSVFRPREDGGGGTHEIVIARGNDLQERKRLLVEGADALAVLPGGPGTWDELWEMACARHIGFHSIPIVCVNVDGYYDPFRTMLSRAHDDQLLYKHPSEILHFEETPEAAVEWIESYLAEPKSKGGAVERQKSSKRDKLNRMQSNVSGSTLAVWRHMESFFGDDTKSAWGAEDDGEKWRKIPWRSVLLFTAGLSTGVVVASRMSSGRRA